MKKWVIGAAMAGVGGLTLLYLLAEEKMPYQMPLSRTVIISILKELKRELVGPLISLANLSLSIRSELKNVNQTEVKNIIKANCKFYLANILTQIKLIEKRVYQRYNTTKKAMSRAYETEFAEDQ